jgi:hypothetical protein
VLLVLIGIWFCIGIRLGIWKPIEYDRYVWLTDNVPIASLLWHHEINAGDDVKKLVATWRPHRVTSFGRWVEMDWYPGGPSKDTISFIGVCIRAQDGVLVYASAYSDDGVLNRVFFNTQAPADETNYNTALGAFLNKLHIQREKNAQLANAPEESYLSLTETNDTKIPVPPFKFKITLTEAAAKKLRDARETIKGVIVFQGDGIPKDGIGTSGDWICLGSYYFETTQAGVVTVSNAVISAEGFKCLTDTNYYVSIDVLSGRRAFKDNILDGGSDGTQIGEIADIPIELKCDLIEK